MNVISSMSSTSRLFLEEIYKKTGLASTASLSLLIPSIVIAYFLSKFLSWLQRQKKAHSWKCLIPPQVPSLIPYLGSAIEMGKDIRQFQLNYFSLFKSPIFTATINGDTCHFIHPTDNFQLLFRTKQFDDRIIQMQFTRNALGVKDKKLASQFIDDVHGVAKPFLDQYHTYLFTKEELNQTVYNAQVRLNQASAKWFKVLSSSSSEYSSVRLFQFVTDAVFDASIASLISSHLANDECRQYHETFDNKIALFHAGVPTRFFPDALRARERLVAKIMDGEFAHGASKMIQARLATYKELHVPAEEGARFILGISWAAVGNSIPAIFWLFYYLMKSKEAYDAVQTEVESVVQGRTSGNESCFTMDELDQMPVLNSAFTEALRLSHGAFSLRQVLEDVPLQVKAPNGETSSYLLEKGSNVMMLMSIMHQDPTIFPNPLSFDYKRFMPDPVTGEQPSFKRNGKVVDPLRFFGGGSHMCPGRKFIVYEAKAFIASLLQQYDMKLSMDELNGTVGIDKTYQGLGVNKPERDVDVLIRKR